MVLGWDPEHLDDDLHRQWIRVVGNEIDLTPLEGGVEKTFADLLEPRPQALDDPWGESFLYEAAQAGVVRRVAEEERGHFRQHGLGARLHRQVVDQSRFAKTGGVDVAAVAA